MPLVEVIWALLLRQRTRPDVQYITRFFCCGLWTHSTYCFPVFSSLALGNFLSSMQWDFFTDFWSSFSVCLSPSSTSFSSTLLCIFYRKRTELQSLSSPFQWEFWDSFGFPLFVLSHGNCLQAIGWGNGKSHLVSFPSCIAYYSMSESNCVIYIYIYIFFLLIFLRQEDKSSFCLPCGWKHCFS